jgi:hypothetical protein
MHEFPTSSSEILETMANSNVRMMFKKKDPIDDSQRDFCTLVTEGGRTLATIENNVIYMLELPREILDDFLRESLVEQIGPEDDKGRTFYRLTPEGRRRAAT